MGYGDAGRWELSQREGADGRTRHGAVRMTRIERRRQLAPRETPRVQRSPRREQYNQLVSIHGTLMLLLFATPLVFAFANFVLPLQLGAPDVAFPRLNALSYWLFLFGGLTVVSGFLTPNGAAAQGWTGYEPLDEWVNSPGAGTDMWIIG